MAKILDTLLLLALPASGKSEVRKYMASLTPEQCIQEFHIGPTVQLDDFPYVHLMRRIDEELAALRQTPLFFSAPDRSFKDPIEWGTLIELLNEDYNDLRQKRIVMPESSARYLFDRLEWARAKVGGPAKLSALDPSILDQLSERLDRETLAMLADKHDQYPETMEGKTIVIEFARGGADGSPMPLLAPMGYQYSLSMLSDEILNRSAILYIWVTVEESRRKNDARADPADPGSILHHGVPIEVMMNDYGCDDMEYLITQSDRPNSIKISTRGKDFTLPIARLDNRVDKTSFIRKDRSAWEPAEIKALHDDLSASLGSIKL